MHAAVFLDRDGTLCHDMENPANPASITLIRGAAAAVASLRGLGYKIVVVTNQGVVAHGRCTEQDVVAAHERVGQTVYQVSGATIDRFYYCPCSPDGAIERYRQDHPWRKPNPGMLRQAATDLQLDLEKSWMIGDRPADIGAGAAAGSRTILLDEKITGVRVAGEEYRVDGVKPDFVAPNLIEAVKIIAQQRRPESQEQAQGLLAMARSAIQAAPKISSPTASAPLASEPTVSATPASQEQSEDSSRLLRQVLQELRGQRTVTKAHSAAMGIAICLQIIAGVCFLGALFMGGTSGLDTFMRWIGCAVFIQLATLTALLFDRR